jgi:hypothetical protein
MIVFNISHLTRQTKHTIIYFNVLIVDASVGGFQATIFFWGGKFSLLGDKKKI